MNKTLLKLVINDKISLYSRHFVNYYQIAGLKSSS